MEYTEIDFLLMLLMIILFPIVIISLVNLVGYIIFKYKSNKIDKYIKTRPMLWLGNADIEGNLNSLKYHRLEFEEFVKDVNIIKSMRPAWV